jgi:hypothetical protein
MMHTCTHARTRARERVHARTRVESNESITDMTEGLPFFPLLRPCIAIRKLPARIIIQGSNRDLCPPRGSPACEISPRRRIRQSIAFVFGSRSFFGGVANEIKLLRTAASACGTFAPSIAESVYAFRRARSPSRRRPLHRYRTRRKRLVIIALCHSGHACLEKGTWMLRDLYADGSMRRLKAWFFDTLSLASFI